MLKPNLMEPITSDFAIGKITIDHETFLFDAKRYSELGGGYTTKDNWDLEPIFEMALDYCDEHDMQGVYRTSEDLIRTDDQEFAVNFDKDRWLDEETMANVTIDVTDAEKLAEEYDGYDYREDNAKIWDPELNGNEQAAIMVRLDDHIFPVLLENHLSDSDDICWDYTYYDADLRQNKYAEVDGGQLDASAYVNAEDIQWDVEDILNEPGYAIETSQIDYDLFDLVVNYQDQEAFEELMAIYNREPSLSARGTTAKETSEVGRKGQEQGRHEQENER